MFYILIASLVIMIASLSGVIFLWKGFGTHIEKNLRYLVSISAGVFLVVAVQMIIETTHYSKTAGAGFVWVLIGALGIYLLFKFLPAFHHHHDSTHEADSHSTIDVRRIMIGDAIHNIADGILIVSSFAVGATFGIIATASILLHEIVQEVSEFFVLKQAGYSTKKALSLNFLVSSSILVGAFGAFFLLQRFSELEAPLLGISAGIFLLVVLLDLIPHSVRSSKKRIQHIAHGACFLIGIGIMAVVILLTPHSHSDHAPHDNHNHEEHHH